MNLMLARLDDRGVVAVGGAEARPFLQNLITTNMDRVAENGAGYGALLTPQGKVLADFVVLADGPRYLFDLPRAIAADFARRLTFYRLRAKVEIAEISGDHSVWAAWGDDAPPAAADAVIARDPRLAALGWRLIVDGDRAEIAGATAGTARDYLAHRLALGVPEGGVDFAYGDAFPHDADMDQLGGIDFRKGCYVGQEVVSRMEHRGTARRRVVPVTGDRDLPPPGTPVTAGGRAVGTLGAVEGASGLALIRLDRARTAMDDGTGLAAGDAVLEARLPDWARFGWPSAAATDDPA